MIPLQPSMDGLTQCAPQDAGCATISAAAYLIVSMNILFILLLTLSCIITMIATLVRERRKSDCPEGRMKKMPSTWHKKDALCVVLIASITGTFASRGECHADSDTLSNGNGYGAVVARVRIVDRQGRPVQGVRVRFDTELNGVVRDGTGWLDQPQRTRWTMLRLRLSAVSGPDGVATARVPPPYGARGEGSWFRGRIKTRATTIPTASQDASAADPDAAEADEDATVVLISDVPATTPSLLATDLPVLRVWETPDRQIEGFPLWLGRDKQIDRVVVLVEGFDLYNRYNATDALRLIGTAGDALRAAGLDILVVNFPNSHFAPDALAEQGTHAVRAASAVAGGHPVAVAGISAGGIVARWSLVTAEESGVPLPVHTLLFLDTPHRGANLNPALQAMVSKYGKQADREALGSEAARVLLTEGITGPEQVRWRRVGIPPAHRDVPVECHPTTTRHDAFYARLHALNDRNGYPKRCRLVAVANSPRTVPIPRSPGALLRMWLPLNCSWALPATNADRAAGSLLPQLYVKQFDIHYPLGLAGAYLRYAPVFLPAASALDADPDQVPPFDAWYACPTGLPQIAHDHVAPGGAAFAVHELLRAGAWDTPLSP